MSVDNFKLVPDCPVSDPKKEQEESLRLDDGAVVKCLKRTYLDAFSEPEKKRRQSELANLSADEFLDLYRNDYESKIEDVVLFGGHDFYKMRFNIVSDSLTMRQKCQWEEMIRNFARRNAFYFDKNTSYGEPEL